MDDVRGLVRRLLPPLAVVAVVLAANGPTLLGLVVVDPFSTVGAVTADATPGVLPGLPTIDNNNGRTLQALGHLAAEQWTSGQVPWWNAYQGIGMPLAGGMQSAAFFPPILLLLLPQGFLLFSVLLQLVAALATFALVRRLGARPWVAAGAGMAFGLTGTLAWLENAAANPVPFLPLLLLGVEHASDAARRRRWGGVALVAVALALSITAGFPETAFLDGLLAAIWTLWRACARPIGEALRFLARVAVGGVAGLLLAAPALLAFLHYLTVAYQGGHVGGFAGIALQPVAAPQLVLPYVYGPIFAFLGDEGELARVWQDTGGYVTALLVTLGLVGLVGRRHRGLRLLLLGWVVLTLGRAYGVPGLTALVNAVPEMDRVAVYRYIQPSAALAVVVLAALGVEDVAARALRWWQVLVPAVVGLGVTGLAAAQAWQVVGGLERSADMAPWVVGSVVWGLASAVVAAIALLLLLRWRAAAVVLGLVLVVDAVGMFALPQLSAPREVERDEAAITFLQESTGPERIFTFGPLAPNYGSYLQVPTLNVYDALTPLRFARHLRAEIDPDARSILFLGTRSSPTAPDAVVELLRHVDGYRAASVRYVVTGPGRPMPPGSEDTLREVFRSPSMTVYRLSGTLPYLSVAGGGCRLDVAERERAEVTCDGPGRLLRRELFFPGWTASVDGQSVPVERVSAYQAVDVPDGSSTVVFSYAPPGATWAWVGLALGVAVTVASALPLRRWRGGEDVEPEPEPAGAAAGRSARTDDEDPTSALASD